MPLSQHPSSLYHAPIFISWIKSKPEVSNKLKQKYKSAYLGMIDAMDAYWDHWSKKLHGGNDPERFLQWYQNSPHEKEDYKDIMSHSDVKESSIMSGIRGVQMPGGNKKRKNVVDVSQPYEEMDESLFEKLVIDAAMKGKNIKEVVRKKGTLFVHFDDDDGHEIASYRDRKSAWEHQRNYRKRKALEKEGGKKKKEKEKEHEKITKDLFWKKKRAVPVAGGTVAKKEELVRMFQKILSEGTLRENILSYVFEQPSNTDVLEWDNFLKGLSKDAIMADPKLKNIITGLMKSEQRILQNSMKIVKDRLTKAGFEVGKSKVSANPENGRLRGEFYCELYDDGKDAKEVLGFGLSIENGRPLLFIPNETKQKLNSMNTQNSKLLRSELLHIQETELDNIDDVVNATTKRDAYFASLEKNMDKMMTNFTPVELAVVKKLLKTKFRNVA